MGRITVFTRWDDLNSKQVLKELEQRGLPYHEIDVAKYPNKGKELGKALDAIGDVPSVPRVYFGARHVGGVEACVEELQKWDGSENYESVLQKFQSEIGSGFEQPTEHLTLPDPDTAVPIEAAKSRQPELLVHWPDNRSVWSLRELMEQLKEWVPLKNCEYERRGYRKSFTGRTLVSSLQHALDVPFVESLRVAQDLCQYGVVRHVDTKKYPLPESNCVFNTDEDVYQLQCDVEPYVLNSYIKWPNSAEMPTDCLGMVDNLHRLFAVMELSSIDPDDGLLNSQHCLKLQKFPLFEEAVCELQHLSRSSFLLLNENELTAFALNVYTVLIRYANLKVGIPRNEADRMHMMENTKFYLAGNLYTLQDWVEMLLRKSRYVRGPISCNLSCSNSNDQTSESSGHFLLKEDNRIQFAFFLGAQCGSRWSAPFSLFTADNLDMQLDIAAKVFCLEDHHVKVDQSEGTLHLLSPAFKLVCDDVDIGESGLPNFILPFLSGDKRLALEFLLNQSQEEGAKAIKISYMEPKLGLHTISGPWYQVPRCQDKTRSKSCFVPNPRQKRTLFQSLVFYNNK